MARHGPKDLTMNKVCTVMFLLPVTCLTVACGSNNRHLQSITIDTAVNGEQIQFTATGTFSASPTSVTPLPVSWSYAPPPPQYNLTTVPFSFDCTHPESPGPIVAMAPADPDAPSSGSMFATKMVSVSGPIPCP
jgi:hypothetical protein